MSCHCKWPYFIHGEKKHRGTDTTMFLYFYSMYHSRPDTLETSKRYINVWDIFHILVTDCDLCQHNVRSTATKVFADTNNKYLKTQEAGKRDVGFEYSIKRIPQKCLTQKAIVALNDRWAHITNRAPTPWGISITTVETSFSAKVPINFRGFRALTTPNSNKIVNVSHFQKFIFDRNSAPSNKLPMDTHSRYKRHWLWCRNQNIKRRQWQTADCVQAILPATSQMTPKTPLANIYKSSGNYTRFFLFTGNRQVSHNKWTPRFEYILWGLCCGVLREINCRSLVGCWNPCYKYVLGDVYHICDISAQVDSSDNDKNNVGNSKCNKFDVFTVDL
jgi:hypothetical protein